MLIRIGRHNGLLSIMRTIYPPPRHNDDCLKLHDLLFQLRTNCSEIGDVRRRASDRIPEFLLRRNSSRLRRHYSIIHLSQLWFARSW